MNSLHPESDNEARDDAGAKVQVSGLIACPGCDLLLWNHETPLGFELKCPRCQRKLAAPRSDPGSRTLALSLTALLLFIPAHFLPLVTFEVLGITQSGSIFNTIQVLLQQGYYLVGMVVLLTGMIFPLGKPLMLFLLCLGLRYRLKGRFLARLLRWYHHFAEWGMTEIYLIAVMITIIKVYHTASVTYHLGFFCCVGLVLVGMLAANGFDENYFWHRIEELIKSEENEDGSKTALVERKSPEQEFPLCARKAGLALCRICGKLLHFPAPEQRHGESCPRCGGVLHIRTPNSLGRTWALVLCALILAFPANLLPIMELEAFGAIQRSTILDGIIYFFHSGSYGIGLIIFIASVLVPLFKIVGMLIILLSVRYQWRGWLRHKILMFRFISFIGRWSMLDIFVIALLCALADFGFFSKITAAHAAIYFSGVVVSSMLAALSFDPRLLWDLSSSK